MAGRREKLITEAEWFSCTEPAPMLKFVHGRVSDRKLRLFASACCRRIEHQILDERVREALQVAEGYFDGLQPYEQALKACMTVSAVAMEEWEGLPQGRRTGAWTARAVSDIWGGRFDSVAFWVAYAAADFVDPTGSDCPSKSWIQARFEELRIQCELARDIFGNPFQASTIDSCWLRWNDGTVPKIAQSIYDDRGFENMPILADALEDAGCDNEDILCHCRESREHVRGCWVIDLLLQKE